MAEVNTDMYKGLGPKPSEPINPAQAIQMLGGLNQAALFSQVYGARQGVGDSYKDFATHGDPTQLQKDISTKGGFEAGPALGQAITNSTNQFAQQKGQLDWLRGSVGALASKKDLSLKDIDNFVVSAARHTNVPVAMIQSIADGARATKGDPGALRKYLTDQSKTALGLGALEPAAGPPDAAGTPQVIPKGEQIDRLTGVTPQAAAPGGQTGMPTAMAPGFQEAAKQSGEVMGAARTRAANFGSDIYPMREALANLEKLGPTGTGAGTDEINTFKNFVNANFSTWLPGVKFDPEKVQSFDEAKKYLTNMAGARASAFGHGTDQALSTALTASPNTHISNLAAVDLTKATIALKRMEQAQILDADAQGVHPGKFTTWASRWATDQDPRAYMIDYMTPEQRKNVQESLKTPAQRSKFKKSYETALSNGLIDAPAQ